jgi:hypothetical protein
LSDAAGEVLDALRHIPNPADTLLVVVLAAEALRIRMARENEPDPSALEAEALAWFKTEAERTAALLKINAPGKSGSGEAS